MKLSLRHLFGLILAVALAALLYWFWQDGLVAVRRSMSAVPELRTLWSELGALIMLAFACAVLGLAQVMWDKLPGNDGEEKH